jgi:hypothetical protein
MHVTEEFIHAIRPPRPSLQRPPRVWLTIWPHLLRQNSRPASHGKTWLQTTTEHPWTGEELATHQPPPKSNVLGA